MNKSTVVLGVVVLVAISFLFGMNFNGAGITGKVAKTESYTYTKAICNSNSECIDVLIECEKGEVKEMKPASDLKNFSDIENWEAPNNTGFCD